MDEDKHGVVIFDEFAEYCIQKSLNLEVDDLNDD